MVAAVVLLLGVGVVALVFTVFHVNSTKLAPGCIEVTVASSTGAGTFTSCGSAAAQLCRAQAARDDSYARAVRAGCRRAGYR